MFGIIKRNRQNVPIRLPEPLELADESLSIEEVAEMTSVTPVASTPKMVTTVTPPLTPSSETNGEGSDEASVEELTVEEVPPVKETDEEKDEEAKTDAQDPPPTEARDPTGAAPMRQDNKRKFKKRLSLSYTIFRTWLAFWSLALAGGVLAYYITYNHGTLVAKTGNNIEDNNKLLLISREKWDDDAANIVKKASSFTAQTVVVVQTDTESCDTTQTCSRLLNAINVMQKKRNEGPMKYNFLLATDGCLYEGLGWQQPSPLHPEENAMVVAFIGNYEKTAPSNRQLSQLHNWLEASEDLKYLAKGYKIVGKKQSVMPRKLFAYLATFKDWDAENSDTDGQNVDIEFDAFPLFEV